MSSIIIYPVKSAQGCKVSWARVTEMGFEHDRRWAIVSRSRAASRQEPWHVENQYECQPRLACIQTCIQFSTLILSATIMQDSKLVVPIRTVPDPRRRISIDKDKDLNAEDEGQEAADWLTTFFNNDRDFRLVYCPPSSKRHLCQDPRYGFLMSRNECTVFADTAQFLLTSESSLAALDPRIPMNRFRPNIVVRGAPEFDEDYWRELAFGRDGELVCRVCMPALRCKVVDNIQQGPCAGERGESETVLATLRRKRPCKLNKGCVFGIKLNLAAGFATGVQKKKMIRVGDECHVLARTTKSTADMDQDELRAFLRDDVINDNFVDFITHKLLLAFKSFNFF